MIGYRSLVFSLFVGSLTMAGYLAPHMRADNTAEEAVAQEVRALRLSIERSAVLTARANLVGQRAAALQSRISSLSIELRDVRGQRERAAAAVAADGETVRQLESTFPTLVNADAFLPEVTPKYREARREFESQQRLEQSLAAKEAELTAALESERRDWTRLSQALDEVERALGGDPNRLPQ